MRDDDEIRISKKLCEYQEDQHFRPSSYRIEMPKGSKYDGYYFLCSTWFACKTPNYIGIQRGRSEKYKFELIKIEREPGKRYARHKLTFDELKAEFTEHSGQFYSDIMPQALAQIKTYRNNGRINACDVIDERLFVGGYTDTWFYVNDRDKRRLDTKGVKIITELSPEEVEPMKARLDRYYKLEIARYKYNELIDEIMRSTSSVGRFYEKIEELLPQNAANAIGVKFDEIKIIVEAHKTEITKEYEALDKYFAAFIEQKPTSREIYERHKTDPQKKSNVMKSATKQIVKANSQRSKA